MIVSRREARRIEGGRKVQHRYSGSRKPVKVGAKVPITYYVPNEGLGYENGLPRLEPVRACYVKVLAVTATTMQEATETDATAEGYRNLDELMEAWGVEPDEEPIPVWVFRFDVIREHVPRFLSRVVAGRQGDYTEVPARGLRQEPEAVDDSTLRRLVREARVKDRERRQEARRARSELTLDEQVAALAAEARARHIDVRDELRAIERWRGAGPGACARSLESLRRKVEGAPIT